MPSIAWEFANPPPARSAPAAPGARGSRAAPAPARLSPPPPTVTSVMKPPPTTAGNSPSHCAATPDSNSPISLLVPMKITPTADTRPRIESGVSQLQHRRANHHGDVVGRPEREQHRQRQRIRRSTARTQSSPRRMPRLPTGAIVPARANRRPRRQPQAHGDRPDRRHRPQPAEARRADVEHVRRVDRQQRGRAAEQHRHHVEHHRRQDHRDAATDSAIPCSRCSATNAARPPARSILRPHERQAANQNHARRRIEEIHGHRDSTTPAEIRPTAARRSTPIETPRSATSSHSETTSSVRVPRRSPSMPASRAHGTSPCRTERNKSTPVARGSTKPRPAPARSPLAPPVRS